MRLALLIFLFIKRNRDVKRKKKNTGQKHCSFPLSTQLVIYISLFNKTTEREDTQIFLFVEYEEKTTAADDWMTRSRVTSPRQKKRMKNCLGNKNVCFYVSPNFL